MGADFCHKTLALSCCCISLLVLSGMWLCITHHAMSLCRVITVSRPPTSVSSWPCCQNSRRRRPPTPLDHCTRCQGWSRGRSAPPARRRGATCMARGRGLLGRCPQSWLGERRCCRRPSLRLVSGKRPPDQADSRTLFGRNCALPATFTNWSSDCRVLCSVFIGVKVNGG